MLTSLLAAFVKFIGRKTFWRINQKDKIYLKRYYESILKIDGNIELAKEQTKFEKEKILLSREANFWNIIGR